MSQGDGARLSIFDDDAEYYVSISGDSRVSLWETASGALKHSYVEKEHFLSAYTCAAWHRERASGRGSKKARAGLLACGTRSGWVSLWDLQRGVVVKRLGSDAQDSGSRGAVTAVAFSANGTAVLSAMGENIVELWDVRDGSLLRRVKGLKGDDRCTALLSHPRQEACIAGGLGLRVVDYQSGKKLRSLTSGHATSVSLMCLTANGKFLGVGGAGSTHVSIFDLSSAESRSATALITLPEEPRVLALACVPEVDGAGTAVYLAAAVSSGNAFVARCTVSAAGKASVGDAVRVDRRGGGDASVVGFRFVPVGGSKVRLVCAQGSFVAPAFEEVDFCDASGRMLPVCLLDAEPAGNGDAASVAGAVDKAANLSGYQVMGPAQKGARTRETDADADADADAAPPSEKRRRTTADNQLTIGERLKALAAAVEEEDEGRSGKEGESEVPTSESLAVVLTQALQSSDRRLLEHCLQFQGEATINATVRKLPAPQVLPLLNAIIGKLEKRHGRVTELCSWITAILTNHTSYILSVANVTDKLGALHEIMEERVQVLPSLLQVAGRLDLIFSQVKASAEPAVAVEEYDDDESEEEEGSGEADEEDGSSGSASSASSDEEEEDDDEEEEEDEED